MSVLVQVCFYFAEYNLKKFFFSQQKLYKNLTQIYVEIEINYKLLTVIKVDFFKSNKILYL